MALVPFRTLGPAADQAARERLFQVGGLALTIRQYPKVGMRTLEPDSRNSLTNVEEEEAGSSNRSLTNTAGASEPSARSSCTASGPAVPGASCSEPQQAARGPAPQDPLGSVGLVAWQCGFLLAELMLRHPPLGSWHDVHVVDLGCGTGLVGIALAVAGASVTLTDLPHVIPLTLDNVSANCGRHVVAVYPKVLEHVWGDAESAAQLLPKPDIITAADVLYDPQYYDALLSSLESISAPHTLVYIAWKKRNVKEEGFEGLAEARGFAVDQVPLTQLAEEYGDGTYAVLRLTRLEAMDVDESRT